MMKSIFNKIKNIKWNKRKTTLALIVFLIVGLTILRVSYGYLGPVTIGASKTTAQVSTASLDELKLENSREMVFENFEPEEPEGNGVVTATATLKSNSDTRYATKTYYVYLLIKNSNGYTEVNNVGVSTAGYIRVFDPDENEYYFNLNDLDGDDGGNGLYFLQQDTIRAGSSDGRWSWTADLCFDVDPIYPVTVTYQIILSENPINNLYDVIAMQSMPDNAKSAYVTNSSGIQFNAMSSDTNGRGLYYLWGSEDYGDYPVYYYRGNVDNNNVIFNNFCWKIVRTTETGGVKLIYNGVPSSGKCTTQTGTGTQISGTYLYNNKSPDSSGSANSPAFSGYMYGTIYRAASRTVGTSKYYYGAGFTYASSKYTLTSATAQTWSSWYNNATFKNRHYTCFQTATGAYSPIYYIHNTTSTIAYYFTISGANTTIATAVSQMLTNSSNATSSTAKDAVDSWYNTNMNTTAVNNKLEDAIWCNDRGIASLGGLNASGGPTYSSNTSDINLIFNGNSRVFTNYSPDLFACSKNDSFTVSDSTNGNAKLTYKTGLITSDELMYAGAKWYNANGNSMYLYTGQSYWTMSPCAFGPINVSIMIYDNTGQLYWATTKTSDTAKGIRPMVSLKHDTTYSSGVGTKDEPYVIS